MSYKTRQHIISKLKHYYLSEISYTFFIFNSIVMGCYRKIKELKWRRSWKRTRSGRRKKWSERDKNCFRTGSGGKLTSETLNWKWLGCKKLVVHTIILNIEVYYIQYTTKETCHWEQLCEGNLVQKKSFSIIFLFVNNHVSFSLLLEWVKFYY